MIEIATDTVTYIDSAIARGDAPIKQEYLKVRIISDKSDTRSEQPELKTNRGQNKNRKCNSNYIREAKRTQLCPILASTNNTCIDQDCKHQHDKSVIENIQQIGEKCPDFELYEKCRYGLNCLFRRNHVKEYNVDKHGIPVSKDMLEDLKSRERLYVKNICSSELKDALKKGTFQFASSQAIGGGNITMDEKDKMHAYEEKRRELLDPNKLMLAPLTTVGNLPFRRICVKLGADITMSEMTLASSIIDGKFSDLTLLRRHASEKYFGVQIATGHVEVVKKCVAFLNEEIECDFIDLNAACPLEPLHKKMMGSILLTRPNILENLASSMRASAPYTPLTMKLRAGFKDKFTIHNVLPQLEQNGIDAFFIHGRTSRQRYTKAADWDYISQCKSVCSQASVIGSGDIFTWQEYNAKKNLSIDNILIGRGALIKPWIFTEIKEQRTIDLSASERLDILKDFVSYGLEHWGSDVSGVETTRSFFYRYIPVGIMEPIIPKLNWRAPPYIGRSDLETLLGSPKVEDWIQISEMFLGKVPPNFSFIPKHKANASSSD